MKLRVYADTSVFSAYHEDRAADRKSLTREFWQNLGAYECSTSALAVEELRQTADLQLRAQMETLLAGFQIISITDEMRSLAEKYLLAGAFTRTMYNDAVHVAAATLSRQDVLVSWNFKHLVNRRRRAMVCGVNARRACRPLTFYRPLNYRTLCTTSITRRLPGTQASPRTNSRG